MTQSALASRNGLFPARPWAWAAIAGIAAYLAIDALLAFLDPWYIAMWAFASAGLAFFPDQPISTGQVHLLLAGIAFTAVAAGTVALSRSLNRVDGLRRYVTTLTFISQLGVLAWVITVAVTKSPIGWFGLIERVFLVRSSGLES